MNIITSPTKSLKQLCAIITTFSPELSIIECVNKILLQVNEVIIIDDGDSKENKRQLRKWFNEVPEVTLWHQPINAGIAAALNVGIKIAKEKGHEWIVTLDDDSIADEDMVQQLFKHLESVNDSKPVGIIGMKRIDNYKNASTKHMRSTQPKLLDKRGIITSGSLFSIKTYESIGPFREDFFIDSVDYDFCMRARAAGFRVIQIQEVGFTHTLGECERVKNFGLDVDIISHSPTRVYYDFRNSTILSKEYFMRDPLFAFFSIAFQFKKALRILFLHKNKKAKLFAIILGLRDAFKYKTGKIYTNKF